MRPSLGSRDDPHTQIREARSQPLLLHSLSVFREIFEIVFTHRQIAIVAEIGVESGQVSGIYLELGASEVYCVDPEPSDQLRSALAGNDALHLVEKPSPEVLSGLPPAQLYVLDGDHNYAVVERELSWIVENAPDAVVVMHDVLWPWSRRDLYYEPSSLGLADRHPVSEDGPTVWHDGLTPAGFVGLGAFTVAQQAGGERNGVATAIEDVLSAARDDWHFVVVPVVFGLGVLVRRGSAADEQLLAALRPYTESVLLEKLENNRIGLYTKVLQMQYDAAAEATYRDQLAEQVAAQRHELDMLTAELDVARAALRGQ